MTIRRLAFIALLGGALFAFGCSDDAPPDGSGGTGGEGTGGSGGTGGEGTGGSGGTGGTGGTETVSIQVVSFGDVLAAVGDPQDISGTPIPGCTRTDNSGAQTDVTFECPDPGPGDYQVSVTATLAQQASVRVEGETQDTVALGAGEGAFLSFSLPVVVPECRAFGECDGFQVCIEGECVPGTFVFVSSTTTSGDIGGVLGADQICEALAEAAGLTFGAVFAWISDSNFSPSDFGGQTIPYYRVDGVKVADDWTDLIDVSLQSPINVDENGLAAPPGALAWTSTSAAGDHVTPDCDAFSSASNATQGFVGDANATGGAWSQAGLRDCNLEFHLYCFEAGPSQ